VATERALILWPCALLERPAFPERIAGHSAAGRRVIGGDFTLEAIEREHVIRS
jgi:hypothetical protein